MKWLCISVQYFVSLKILPVPFSLKLTCCCRWLFVANSSCQTTDIQEVELAEAKDFGGWSSEETTAGWWAPAQQGKADLAGLELQKYSTRLRRT